MDPKSFGRVGVLLGGKSGEREISLMSGNGVLEALRAKGVDAHAFDTGLRCPTELAKEKFDRIFISLHGRFGEDGTIQGLLELLGLPYTGSGVLASALAIDKIVTKQVWISNGLATPDYEELTARSDWNAVVKHLGLPLIVKPAHEGSSLGLTKVKSVDELPAAYKLAAGLDKKVIAETCIIGDELTCPLIGQGNTAEALPVIKIIPPQANYDFHNKYFSDETQYLCPTGLAPEVNAAVQELALAAYKALGCRTWGRADVMLEQKTGKPYLLEMNTSPGMTSHSLVPMAAKAAGIEYADLVLWLLSQTLQQKEGAST
ncbi:D-alanine--D-alanine ligase [Polynucleobacter sp. JS-Polo-80-F4]|nr:D-alanine--D-alanine ligase [Polynucleobacter sp. JS-Polo-80-F4]